MLKFNSKRDVDRHVTQLTKNLNDTERSKRGLAIAKSYAKVSEYEIARDWLQRYLDTRPDDVSAHKFMGEIYEHLNKPEAAITSYQRAYNLSPKQTDLIKNICRLFLINDSWTSSSGKAKYWCELAEEENIRDDSVLSLRLKILNKDKKSGGGKAVEEMILKEIAARPHDVGLRIRLVKFLLDEKRVSEAFKYCFDIEMKFMEIFLLSVDWYMTVSSVLAQHTPTDSWNYWCLLLMSLDKKIYLNLKKDLSLQAIKQNSIKDVTNLLFEFDQVLKKAADSLMVLAPVKEFAEELVNHFRGQMALNIASLLFQKQKVASNDQWRETTKKCLPFLFFAFQSATANTDAFWLKNTNETIRNLFTHLRKEGAFRCAQAGRTILACEGTSEAIALNIRNYKSWTSIEDIFNQVREICVDLNWRKNIYRQLFANADQQTKVSSSYFAQNSFFLEPNYDIISFNELESFESMAQYLYPSSLEHHAYLCLGRNSYKCHTFSGLNLSTSNLINCNPETINRLDIDSFLYCAVIQAKRRLEAERDCYESFSNKPNEKPLILPAANMVEGLCTEEQNDWWLSAFKIYKNITGENLAQLKATLQFGIEAVRGIDTPKVDIIILLKLGEILLARADKVDEKRHLELRAEYVYKMAMRMLKTRESDNTRRIFKFATTNYDIDLEIENLSGTAIEYLANVYFHREEFKEFLEDFANIQNPWAHYYRAQAYKKLDESSKTPKKSKKFYVEKSRESLMETLTLLENNDSSDKNNTLRQQVERDLKKMQYNMSSSFNDDLDFHNASQNGHNTDDEYLNASATSFRARRNISASSMPNYTEKFTEIENLIRKLSDQVVTVKDDVKDIKDDLRNIRGDISDINVNRETLQSKSLETVYKAIEELTLNVSYLLNATAPPTGAARFPPNLAQINQMYNTAYPMYPMTYPAPPMVQQRPQQPGASLQYDPLGQNLIMNPLGIPAGTPRSSLIDALNNPSLLSTWNNTYNQQPMTPPNHIASPIVPPQPPVAAPLPTIPVPVTIINKPVEKTPPVNVVITSSDPLPAQNSFVSQPTLSVTIPSQHIKHTPHPTFPQQPIMSSGAASKPVPQYENISPTRNNTSEYLEEPADYDPRPDFKPIIPLPDEVEVKTGEEDEDIMFSERCKLFRYDGEWKERGIGQIKILKNKATGKYRILMRREQIHKLCANHAIAPEMELKSTEKSNQFIWGANDFSEEQMRLEKFLVRFKNDEQARRFKDAFEEAKKSTPKTPAVGEKPKEPLKAKDDNVKVTTSAPVFGTKDQTQSSTSATQPKATFSFGGFTGNLTASPSLLSTPTDVKSKDKEAEKTKASPFATFSFGQTSGQASGYSVLFNNIPTGKSDSMALQAQPAPAESTLNRPTHEEDDHAEHYEPTAQFEPVIPLPDLVEAKTGEEDENVLFSHRAKLLRFDPTNKEWKERGIGEMKVLVNKNDSSKARLLMRREQVLKLCCNMVITSELKFKRMNANTYSFGGQDFSENEMKSETLAIKFKTSELIEQFLEAVRAAQKNLSVAKPTAKEPEKKKEEVKGFGDLFKPKAGSWDCSACYISNKPDVLYCVACETPKDSTVPQKESKSALAPSADAPKFSFGMPAAVSKEPEKKTEKGFGDQFKPKAGSWDCSACYISNKPDVLYCVACETPKDSTVPKKESKSALAPSADAPKFSFGMPGAGGFAFGSPAATTQPSSGLNFGSLAVTSTSTTSPSNFSFGSLEKPAETAADSTTGGGFMFGKANAFSFGKNAPASAPAVTPVLTESASFNFVFKKKSPSKSPGKARNDSVNSEGGDDEEYHEEEENQTYFTPVIPLPDKVEVKTGEEDETVLYSHRAKLFRFADKEWKERGLGDVKILKHNVTGKLRVVMRREQILKICLNFFLTDEIEFKRKDDNSWTFAAGDYSEGELEAFSFAIRFKNKELADEFKKAVEDAVSGGGDGQDGNASENQADEKSQLAEKLKLPGDFFEYLDKPDCSGCVGCNSDSYVYSPNRKSEFVADVKEISQEPPILKAKAAPKAPSADKHVSFSFTVNKEAKEANEDDKVKQLFGTGKVKENTILFGGGIKKSEGSLNIFAASEKSPQSTNIFGSKTVGSFNTSGSSIFSSSLNTTPAATTTETGSSFGAKTSEPFSGGLFGTKSSFSFGENVFGVTKQNGEAAPTFGVTSTPFGSNIFGSSTKTDSTVAPTQPTSVFGSNTTGTFSFADAAKNQDKPEASKPDSTSPQTNIFGSSLKSTFSFTEAAKNLDKPKESSVEVPQTNIFGANTKSTFSFADTAKSLDNSKDSSSAHTSAPVPDFLSKTNDSGGFAALAASSPDKGWSASTTQSPATGGFIGLTVKEDIFSKNMNKQGNGDGDTSHNDENSANDENYDPHYDPIISLPDEIKVSTGEEDEEKIFGERAKLFRYDAKNKEWKERGVGELKILYHPENRTYRILLRREQIFKLVLNQLISSDFTLAPMNNSLKAYNWAGMNYAERPEGDAEQLAVRFKNEDLANTFKAKIEECVKEIEKRENLSND